MKPLFYKRLDRIEAQRAKAVANEVDLKKYDVKRAVMAIVAFHAGKLTQGESCASAVSATLGLADGELRRMISRNSPDDDVNVWRMILNKLNDLIIERGGPSIMKDGEFCLETQSDGVSRRNRVDVLEELYQEVPEDVKECRRLMPYFADYLL